LDEARLLHDGGQYKNAVDMLRTASNIPDRSSSAKFIFKIELMYYAVPLMFTTDKLSNTNINRCVMALSDDIKALSCLEDCYSKKCSHLWRKLFVSMGQYFKRTHQYLQAADYFCHASDIVKHKAGGDLTCLMFCLSNAANAYYFHAMNLYIAGRYEGSINYFAKCLAVAQEAEMKNMIVLACKGGFDSHCKRTSLYLKEEKRVIQGTVVKEILLQPIHLLVIALKQVKDGIPATDVTVSMIDYLLRQCAKWVDVVKPRYANSCPSPSILDEAEQVMMDALKGVKERTVIDRDLSEGDTLRSLIFKHCRS